MPVKVNETIPHISNLKTAAHLSFKNNAWGERNAEEKKITIADDVKVHQMVTITIQDVGGFICTSSKCNDGTIMHTEKITFCTTNHLWQ